MHYSFITYISKPEGSFSKVEKIIKPAVVQSDLRKIFEKEGVRIPKVAVSPYYLYFLLLSKDYESKGS